ncbi:MAG TPA: cytochrome c peroxidase [Candidatus Eisenbacteria bacterium]|nr:cytochrome c peroxidase [Candidatus Eisenbacteria bacterium]
MILLATAMVRDARAHGDVPGSLQGVEVPKVPGLLSGHAPIVHNRAKAIALGKALFWDMQVGSDGMACASCHFHAGADARVKNQLSPGRAANATFGLTASGGMGGSNYTLRLSDFPFHRLDDVSIIDSTVLFDSDDVAGSGGAFAGVLRGGGDGSTPFDDCTPGDAGEFTINGLATRAVTSRNAPSVIGAAFNRRSFWDGRANAVFNGVNPYGDRDPSAGVWMWRAGRLRHKRLRLQNASLASQAVQPPLDPTEMSCSGRTFPDLGRKLLRRRALQFQAVHPADGVLGPYRAPAGKGLRRTYASLVRAAFDRRFWAAPSRVARGQVGTPTVGGAPFDQMEANFAFFFGLAVQLYESTLIADQTPFDGARGTDGVPVAFDDQQRRGLAAFVDLHCAQCHRGPTLSGSTFGIDPAALTEVDRKPLRGSGGEMVLGLVDTGFINTGVVPRDADPGIGGSDPFGNPLSFTAQYLAVLAGGPTAAVDDFVARSCAMSAPFAVTAFGQPPFPSTDLVDDPAGTTACTAPRWAAVPSPSIVAAESAQSDGGRLPLGVQGAFKVPSLRNVELTGPYMHNGGMATLDEVVEFYNRGGNFASLGKDAEFLFGIGAAPDLRADLVAFLRTLTDERVRWERAPFDHPALSIPHGHVGDEHAVDGAGRDGRAATEYLEVPAVPASGRSAADGPLLAFDAQAPP